MPHPSPQDDPLKYMAHARTESVAMSVLILFAIRSANAYPLTAFVGWYRISNSDSANIHFRSQPFNTEADSMCLITSDLQMTIVSADTKI
jgi:hypothetical protein